MKRLFQHPNADGRLFRVSHVYGNNWMLEVARVPHAGNLIPLDEGLDREEAQEFADSCEEFARAWAEDWRPYWLMKRLCRMEQNTPCASVNVTSEGPPWCPTSGRPLDEWCLPCCARAWLAEFGTGDE